MARRAVIPMGLTLTTVMTLTAASARAAAPDATHVLWADPSRAILATAEGKRLAKILDDARASVEEEVRVREERLARARRELERTGSAEARRAWDDATEALSRFIDAEEARLEALQDERLAPLVARVGAITAKVHDGAVILDATEHPLVVATAACDATAWLARALDGAAGPAPRPEVCRAHVLLRIEPRAIAVALGESKRASDRLDGWVRQRQLDLDAKAEALRRAPPGVETERRRLELADRYQAHREALAVREREEEVRVAEAVRAEVARVEAELPGARFVEAVEGARPAPIATCEGTRWLVDLVQKTRAATGGPPECPAFAREGNR
ncbi:hypothetical protein L6R52_39725 [Myxococcota bacterium]|nr:hypothetical protein [Myxococcota bacterium]